MRVRLFLLLLLVALPISAKDKKPKHGGLVLQANVVAQAASAPAVVAAQPCANWAWAAGVEAVLTAKGVRLSQSDIVIRTYGGEICRDAIAALDVLAKGVNGNHANPDGTRVALELQFASGAPAAADPLLLALQQGRTLVFVVQGRPVLLTAVVYDEYTATNGGRMFIIKQLRFVDPVYPLDSPHRQVSFTNGKDEAAKIDGVYDVAVTARDPGRF